jgi:hypothetical protein
MSEPPSFSVVPTMRNSALIYRIDAINELIMSPDIVSFSMLQDGSVRIPKIEIATVAAGKFAANGSTIKAKNLSVSSTEPGKYTATFDVPRLDCNYQINIQLHQDDAQLDDFGAYVITTVCNQNNFEYYIIESDNGGSAGTLTNLQHTITVTDFLV